MNNHSKIYKTLVNLLEKENLTREELISRATKLLVGYKNTTRAPIGKETETMGNIGAVLYEMLDLGVASLSTDGYLSLCASKPVVLRAESCEREILLALKDGAKSKFQIRSMLETSFGTKRTPSFRDDNILYSYIGQILKRLLNIGVVVLTDGKYAIAEKKRAKLDDIDALLAIKSEFLNRLHSKGGEFFEHYFMTLLAKYLSKQGKTVTECYITGGSADGGIDGVAKTVDTLGFKENILVQTKNRLEPVNETAMRGFYGAVCAQGGSRGIFATTSDFHTGAVKFLEGIDNCVGVNSDMLFNIARECQYGIKLKNGKYIIDTKII